MAVLQRTNEITIDLLTEARNDLANIGKSEEDEHLDDEKLFAKVQTMLASYQQRNKEAFSDAYYEVYSENFVATVDMALLNWCREYKNNASVAPELNRYLSLIAEWQSFIKQTLIRKNPFFSKKMY